MEQCTRFLALTIAAALAAGPAWAQTSTTPSDKGTTGGATGTTDKSTTGTMDKSTGAADKGTMDKSAAKSDRAMKGDRMAGGNREEVKQAQQALKDKGHDPGPVDGVMGPRTQAALRDFQKKEGIRESGRLDRETMSKLGVAMKTGAADSSSPAASPATGDTSSSSSASPSTSGSSAPSATPSGSPSTDMPKTDESKKQ
jgi:peptidoglycan hydrolase-like protein with peptidoglycan-binding domain